MRKKKQKYDVIQSTDNATDLQVEYAAQIDTDPKYSLEIDPLNKYHFTDVQKMFIKYYLDFRNIITVAALCNIDENVAREWFTSPEIQSELRRLNTALYHRQFTKKLLSLDEIGGYLSSLLTDENLPIVDRLSTTDKLRVADMIVKLNQLKLDTLNNPTIIIEKDLETQIKSLSVDTIRQLLLTQQSTDTQQEDKQQLIDQLDSEHILTSEDKTYLMTLSVSELLKMLEDTNTNKGGQNE